MAVQHCSEHLEMTRAQAHPPQGVVDRYGVVHRRDKQRVLLKMVDTWSAVRYDSRSFRMCLEGIKLAYTICESLLLRVAQNTHGG